MLRSVPVGFCEKAQPQFVTGKSSHWSSRITPPKTKVTGGGLFKACTLYLIVLHIYCRLEFDYCQMCFFFGVQRMYPTSEEVLISRMWSTEMQVKIREEKQLVENDPGK